MTIPTQPALTCPEPGCGAAMQLRPSRFGLFYGCVRFPTCRGTHGAHPDGRPLGVPASTETKQARIRAHEAFDRLWRSGRMDRRSAYHWMQQVMGLTSAEAHIGRFDRDQCEQLIVKVEQFLGEGRTEGSDEPSV